MRKGGLTWDAGAKLVWELGDEVIVDPVLHGSEHDDRPRVVDCDGETHKRLSRSTDDTENNSTGPTSEAPRSTSPLPFTAVDHMTCLSTLPGTAKTTSRQEAELQGINANAPSKGPVREIWHHLEVGQQAAKNVHGYSAASSAHFV